MFLKQLNRRFMFWFSIIIKKMVYPNRYIVDINSAKYGKRDWFTELKSQKGAKLELENLIAATNVHIVAVSGSHVKIGKNCFFNRNCIVVARKNIYIGDNCSFGPNVCIYDHDHTFGMEGKTQGYATGEVVIGDNCWIGAGTIILKNTIIGDNCVIGASCLVKGVIPSNSLVTMSRELIIENLK